MPSPPELEKARRDRGGTTGGEQQGKGHVQGDEVKRLQALQMIEKRVAGKSLVKIGEEMGGISADTVKRRLEWAKREGLLAQAEERIINELVPRAIDAFKTALEEGQYEAARDVLFGTGLLSRNPSRAADQVEMTLEQWREQRKAKLVVTTTAPHGAAQGIVQALGHLAEDPLPIVVEGDSSDGLSPSDGTAAAGVTEEKV